MLKFRTHGKWILAGEHSVLRGGSALVFPVESRFLDFSYEPGGEGLTLSIEDESPELRDAFWMVLDKALARLDLTRIDLKGRLKLSSNIPVGAGMGASATLCVSLAKWLSGLGLLGGDKQYEFAKGLEDIFHGESSGVDVAVALNQQALEFKKPNLMKSFFPNWKPHFYLSYSGTQGETALCIEQVQNMINDNRELADSIDQDMQAAVNLAKNGLESSNNLPDLIQSINLAKECFKNWGLITEPLKDHMSWLEEHGALATKPTGSGNGGFVLSLWNSTDLPAAIREKLIKA